MTTTTLRIPEKVLKSLKLISIKEQTSINKIMNNLLIEYLEDYLDSKDADKALDEMEGKSWVELNTILKNI